MRFGGAWAGRCVFPPPLVGGPKNKGPFFGGVVGPGGIGFLADRLRAYELQEACLIIILVVLTVYAIDYLSKLLRERLIGDNRRRAPVDDAKQV